MWIQIKFIRWLVGKILKSESYWPVLPFSNPSEAIETFLLTSGYGEAQPAKQLRLQGGLGPGWVLRWPSLHLPTQQARRLHGGQFRNHFTRLLRCSLWFWKGKQVFFENPG